jgi:dTMP kinase
VLVSFEGIDGSGKTTQINLLKKRAESAGFDVYIFREPGGTEISEAIRGLLLNTEADMNPVTEMLLFSAARSELISKRVLPLLKSGKIVILDRFFDSTVAYQGYGRDSISLKDIHHINSIAAHGIVPELTFYLRIPLDVATKRRSMFAADRMERSGTEFYTKVINGFDEIAKSSARFNTLDALESVETLHDQIWSRVTQLLDSH